MRMNDENSDTNQDNDPTVAVSLRLKKSGHDWVREEARRRGISMIEMYRELFRLGAGQVQQEQR